jgi:hypothetical protein
MHQNSENPMILTPLKYDLASLLNSNATVVICQADGERLKRLILLLREAGWGVVVVETVAGDHYVVATADPLHQGNLLGDTRRWNREHGYQFFFNRANERISPSQENVFVLPEGSALEIRRTYTIASGFTNWALSGGEPLPDGYVRL